MLRRRLDPYFAGAPKPSLRVEVWNHKAKRVRSGKLSWSIESKQSWLDEYRPPDHFFIWFDAAVPSWAACEKTRTPPTTYFKLSRHLRKQEATHQLLLAVQREADLPDPIVTMTDIADALSPVSLHKITGPFGETTSGGRGVKGLSNAIPDWPGGLPPSGSWRSRRVKL